MTRPVSRLTAIPFPSTRNLPTESTIRDCIAALPKTTVLTPANWKNSPHYRYGIDLFNHGYWWEAHVAWEELWHASGHHSESGRFLKALIQCTGALFKYSQGSGNAASMMGEKAIERLKAFPDPFMGMKIGSFSTQLSEFLRRKTSQPPVITLTGD